MNGIFPLGGGGEVEDRDMDREEMGCMILSRSFLVTPKAARVPVVLVPGAKFTQCE